MKKKNKYFIIAFFLMLIIVLTGVVVTAKTVSTDSSNPTIIEDLEAYFSSGNGSVDYTGTVLTISATGTQGIGCVNQQTTSLTLKNPYSIAASINLTVQSASGTLKIGGTTYSAGQTYSGNIGAGSSLAITLQSSKDTNGQSCTMSVSVSWPATQLTLKIKRHNDIVLSDGTNVSPGTVTYTIGNSASVNVSNDIQATFSSTDTIVFKATANQNYSFYAWLVEIQGPNNTVVKKVVEQAIYTYANPKGAFTITPIFKPEGSAMYLVGGVYYHYLDEAISAAGTSGTVVLCGSGKTIHSKGETKYVIPSGVTLLVPFDNANTLCTTTPGVVNSYTQPTIYRTLTLSEGENITVNGAISLSANQSSTMSGHNGAPTGPVSRIDMEAESSITISNGAALYAWGFITGDGTVTVKSGGTVYEDFQGADYRGGSATSTVNNDHSNRVFPMSQYYIQNVEVPMTLEAGANEYAYFSVYVSGGGIQSAAIPLIGASGSGCMFEVESGSITKQYDPATDHLIFDVDGTSALSNFNFSLQVVLIGSITLKTEEYVLPINNNISVNVKDGSTLNIDQDIALLPGSELYIMSGGKCVVGTGKNIYVYDLDEWAVAIPTDDTYYSNYAVDGKIGFCSEYNKFIVPVSYSPTKTGNRTYATLTDASIRIDGTFDADAGAVYTTAGGANIYSTGKGIFYSKAGTSTVTYQMTSKGSDRKGVKYHSIAITPAKLKNGASSESVYTDTNATSEPNTYYYCLYHEQWSTDNHEAVVTITQPTCQKEGSVIVTCGTESRTVETIAKVSHAWSEQSVDGNVYTCTCKYECGADVVLNVKYRLDDYLWFNGYTGEGFYVNDGVTVSDNIQTVVANNIRYFIKAIPADEIPDELTFTATIKGGEATFTVSLKNYVTEKTALKDALLAYGDAAKDYFEKTYKKGGTSGYKKPGYSLIAPDEEDTVMGFQPFGDVNIVTQGATIYFDEALRLAVKYRLSGVESNKVTIDGSEYTIVQVGLLAKELTDWKMGDVLTTSTDGCTAYLVYNTTDKQITSGGVNNKPNGEFKGEASANMKQFNLSGMITFDLKSKDYAKGFALRTYVVLQDANGNYQCVYGKQYGYGLGAYINAMYNEDAAASAEDKSFNNLLEKVWALAQETAK